MKNAIKEGKIALEDKEGIDKIRKSVTVNAEDVNLDADVSVDMSREGWKYYQRQEQHVKW